jgi:CIC family chloride channel protein
MTGNLSMLAPAMVAVGVSTIIVGNTTIYRAQVPSRADSPAHRLQLTFPLLGTLTVQQAMAKLTVRFVPEQTIASAAQLLSDRPETGAPVVDARGRLLGVLTQADIQRVPVGEREKRLVREIMRRDVVVFHPSDTLDDALECLASRHVSWAPVVSLEAETGARIVLGWLSAADIMKVYRSTLLKDTQKMGRVIRRTTRNAQAKAKAEATQPLDSSVADAYMEQQQKGKTQNLLQTVNLLQTRKLQQTQKLQSQIQDGQEQEVAEQGVPKK